MDDTTGEPAGATSRDAQQRLGEPASPSPESAPEAAPDFAALYRPLVRTPFAQLAERELGSGGEGETLARGYAERGKPDYVLVYLLASNLPDAEKREIFAYAHERRAALTEQRARQFSRQFSRPFPLLFNDAAADRALARRIRSGRPVQRAAGRHLPTI